MRKIFFLTICLFLLAGTSVFAAEPNIDGYTENNWMTEADFQFNRGDYNRALNACINVLTLNNHNDYAYFLRGASYAKMGIYHQAVTEFSSAISINPNRADYYAWRAAALSKLYVYDEASSDFTKALALNPNDSYCYMKRGQTYQEQHMYREAIADFDKSISLPGNPNAYFVYYYKGMACEELGLKDQALASYKTFLQNAPRNLKPQYVRYAQDRISDLS